jgi:hypothetical protein
MRKKFGWRWRDGFCTYDHSVVPFLKKILLDPSDEVTRLVLADYLEEHSPIPTGTPRKLRLSGHWSVNLAVGRRHYGLTWWGFQESAGVVLCYVSIPNAPKCSGRSSSHMVGLLSVSGKPKWECARCRWPKSYGE